MRRRERWAAAGVGLVLLALALPRLGAAVAELPGRPVLEALEHGQTPEPQALRRLADAARAAGKILPSGDAARAEAAALLALGDARAAEALAAGLAHSPADPYGWLRLAHVETDPARAVAAFGLSLRTGPWERELALDRVAVGARLLPHLDAAGRSALFAQVRWLWRLDAPALARRLPPAENWAFYRRALSADPEALAAVARRVGMD